MKFEVLGEPCGKGRPRFSRQGTFVRTYTPAKTASYENLVKLSYGCAGGTMLDGEVQITIYAFFGIPKSVSKKQRAAMLAGTVRPTKKPDADNVLKLVADALNGIAYKDDTQIVTAHVEKWYAEEPRVEIEIIERNADRCG